MKSRILPRSKSELNINFDGKTVYLEGLLKKKIDGLKHLEEEKAKLIIDKLLGKYKLERNYLFFQITPAYIMKRTPQKFKFTPDLKLSIQSQEEKDDPMKYKKKMYDADTFSAIYKVRNSADFPKSTLPIRYRNDSILANFRAKRLALKYKSSNFLSNAGNDIVVGNINSRYYY